jgi:hypothetical protein
MSTTTKKKTKKAKKTEIFVFISNSSLALITTQPPIQGVLAGPAFVATVAES